MYMYVCMYIHVLKNKTFFFNLIILNTDTYRLYICGIPYNNICHVQLYYEMYYKFILRRYYIIIRTRVIV